MSLNPWVALILGVLIGWLLQWLLELWFFRRRRLECQERLAQVEADLQVRAAELHDAQAHAESLEADLTALRAKPVTVPAVGVDLPKVELPEVEVAAPEVDVQLPKVDVDSPEVALPEVDVELPEVDVDLPEVELSEVDVEAPEVDVELPKVDVDLPEVEAPSVDLDALKGKVAGGVAAAGGLVAGLAAKLGGKAEAPEIDVESPEVELPEVDIEAPQVDVELPKVEVDLPEVALPEVDVELPKVDVDLPEVELPEVDVEAPRAEVDWPALSADLGQVEVDAPELNFSAPSIGAEFPAAVGLPEAAVEALSPTAGPQVAADDLTLVPGIGPKYAAQLAAAGITSYAALSAAQPDQLRAIINAPDWRRVDYDAWIAGASALMNAPRAAGLADDLTLVEGIGAVYAAKLNAAGINTFAELAAADESRLQEIIQAPAWRRTNYDEWITQARLAAAGDQEGLKALQAKLFNRVRRASQEA